MDLGQRRQKITEYLKTYGSISNTEAQALTNAHRNTISGDFKKLIGDGILIRIGEKKGTRYQLIEGTIFLPEHIESVFIEANRQSLERYFKKREHKKVFFNKTCNAALHADFSFSKDISALLYDLKNRVKEKRAKLGDSERKRKKEKLVIDLSWSSSSIEGNTYSLLETEALIKHNETAKGRSFAEAQMILNHKTAIEYIREGKDYKKLSKRAILELHQLLINNLYVGTGFREHLIAISNSSFVPCDNQFQIVAFFDEVLQKINTLESVLGKVVAANLLIAYLQPFSDGNKRTSRMLGNAILISNDISPISFFHTPKEEYIKAVLYFYEKQDPGYFKCLVLHELNHSFREYIG